MNDVIEMTDDSTINVKLTETSFYRRWPCHICGGTTEKVSILAEVESGPYKGFRVCEICISARDFDAKLEARAATLEAEASALRGAMGRLDVPSWRDYRLAELRHDAEVCRDRMEPGDDEDLARVAALVEVESSYGGITQDDVLRAYGVTLSAVEAAQRQIEAERADEETFDIPF